MRGAIVAIAHVSAFAIAVLRALFSAPDKRIWVVDGPLMILWLIAGIGLFVSAITETFSKRPGHWGRCLLLWCLWPVYSPWYHWRIAKGDPDYRGLP